MKYITSYKQMTKMITDISENVLLVEIVPNTLVYIGDVYDMSSYCVIIDHYEFGKQFGSDITEQLIYKLGRTNRLIIVNKTKAMHQMKISLKDTYDLELTIYLIRGMKIKKHSDRLLQNYYSINKNNNYIIPMPLLNRRFQYHLQTAKMITQQDLNGKQVIFYNSQVIQQFYNIQSNGIFFGGKLRRSKYKFNTIVGRPTIISKWLPSYNLLTIPKGNQMRTQFSSRFGDDGVLVQIDYHAFHIYIISELISYQLPNVIDVYKYFSTEIFKDQSNQSRQKMKIEFFTLLYGHFQYEKFKGHQFFQGLKVFIDNLWSTYRKHDKQMIPIIERKIKNVQSKQKVFNYLILNLELKYNIDKLRKINQFFEDKQSCIVLYKYDSILFDIKKGELKDALKFIIPTMKDGRFVVTVSIGDDYGNMKELRRI